MTLYHGTSKNNWLAIQREGVLFGVRNAPSRCTYLAVNKSEADKYGDVVLEVEFDPEIDTPNNWEPDCWQVRVYAPIEISRVKLCNPEPQS